eukprot:6177500-Karenia_brevis.AAC.1
MEYGWDIEERCYRLCEKFLDVSVLDYAVACELALRTKAVELARGAPAVPWGHALRQAMRSEVHVWQDNMHVLRAFGKSLSSGVVESSRNESGLVPYMPNRVNNTYNVNEPPPAKGGKRPSKGQGKGQQSLNKAKTCTAIEGQEICKKFNDRR